MSNEIVDEAESALKSLHGFRLKLPLLALGMGKDRRSDAEDGADRARATSVRVLSVVVSSLCALARRPARRRPSQPLAAHCHSHIDRASPVVVRSDVQSRPRRGSDEPLCDATVFGGV